MANTTNGCAFQESVFNDESSEVSWAAEPAEAMPGPRKTGKIPRYQFMLRPKVFFRGCSCGDWQFEPQKGDPRFPNGIVKINREAKLSKSSEPVHPDFQTCWLSKIKQFIEVHRMAEYIDGEPKLISGPHQTDAIGIICTANAMKKLVFQGPNILAAYDYGRV